MTRNLNRNIENGIRKIVLSKSRYIKIRNRISYGTKRAAKAGQTRAA